MNDEREYRDHALSRIYREGSWPEPGRQIDRAILTASRRAARARHPVLWRWAPSLAVAATVVLTSTLVLKVYREQPEVAAPVTAEKRTAALPAKEPALPEAKPVEAKSVEAKPVTPPPASVTTPQGFSSSMDAGEAERLDRAKRDLGLKEPAPAGATAQAAAKPAPAPKAAPALKKEEPARADAPGAAAPAAPVSVFGATPQSPQPAPQPAPQQAVRVGKPTMSYIQGTTAAPQPRPEAAQDMMQLQAAPPTEARQAPAANNTLSRNAESGANPDAASGKAAERSPQSWIEDIRKLVKEGKSEEAGAQIAEFKKRYPDYALPEDLR